MEAYYTATTGEFKLFANGLNNGRSLSSASSASMLPHLGRSLALTPGFAQTKARETEKEPPSYLLGGYGYFDVGDFSTSRPASPEPPASKKWNSDRHEIGRKLRLAEY